VAALQACAFPLGLVIDLIDCCRIPDDLAECRPRAVQTRFKVITISKVFGNIPLDREYLDWLYARRHLATVRDGKWRELRYVVELDELEHAILETLARIRKRDGEKIARKVADRLADSIAAKK
jgi:hypothetical protein